MRVGLVRGSQPLLQVEARAALKGIPPRPVKSGPGGGAQVGNLVWMASEQMLSPPPPPNQEVALWTKAGVLEPRTCTQSSFAAF